MIDILDHGQTSWVGWETKMEETRDLYAKFIGGDNREEIVFTHSTSEGKITEEMKSVFIMTDKLKADLSHLHEEHKEIVAALDNLIDVAKKENNMEHACLCRKTEDACQN